MVSSPRYQDGRRCACSISCYPLLQLTTCLYCIGLNHEAKAELPGDRFGDLQREEILDLARRWRRHSVYWQQAPVLTHTLRYEDLKAQPVPNVRCRVRMHGLKQSAKLLGRTQMMALVSFLLPDEDLPPLEDIA